MKTIYITKCGCEAEWKDSDIIKGNPHCLEHNERAISRKLICECGEVVPYGIMGRRKDLCHECFRLAQNKRRNILRRKRRKLDNKKVRVRTPRKKPWSFDPRGDYCTGMMACKMVGVLNCHDCGRFVPIFRGVDPERLGYWR